MNYYYDLTLDFLENNYPFYEVAQDDNLLKVKKIPLMQIDSQTFKDFILNKIKVAETFLSLIKDKTILDDNTTLTAVIFVDKNNAVALKFNNDGLVIAYSPIAISEELNLLEVVYTIKKMEINYTKLALNKPNLLNRQEEKIKKIIITEINKLYQENNLAKLQYLYLEWCDKLENDINKIYEEMQVNINKVIGINEEKLSQIIEMSYNNV